MTTISITLDNPGLVSSLKELMLNMKGVRDFRIIRSKSVSNKATWAVIEDSDGDSREEIIANLKEAAKSLKLIREGKLETRPLTEFLDEL